MSSAEVGAWSELADLSRRQLDLLKRCASTQPVSVSASGGRELQAALGQTLALLELVRGRRREVILSLQRKRQAREVKAAYDLGPLNPGRALLHR